jgi:hypothetical protein
MSPVGPVTATVSLPLWPRVRDDGLGFVGLAGAAAAARAARVLVEGVPAAVTARVYARRSRGRNRALPVHQAPQPNSPESRAPDGLARESRVVPGLTRKNHPRLLA